MSRVVRTVGLAFTIAFVLVVVLGPAMLGVGSALATPEPSGGPAVFGASASLTPAGPLGVNASERLPVAADNATWAYGSASLDPAASTSMSFERAQADFEAYHLQETIVATGDPDEQLDRIEAEIAALSTDLDAMYDAEQATYQAFAAGTIDTATATMQLARVHNRALALEDRANGMRIAIGSIDATDRRADVNVQRGRLRRVQMDARAFHGPVGEQLLDGIAGESAGDNQLWLASTEHGYEIATIHGSGYTREAFYAPNRERDGGEVFRSSDLGITRAATLYPWTFENAIGQESDMSGGLFWSSVDHPHGTTRMYLDATTDQSFREAHELNLGTLEYPRVASQTTDNISVEIERAFTSGPTRVRVVDETTGDPVQGATVRIGDIAVGSTRADGVFRTIAPTETTTVVVETGAATIVATVPGAG